MTPQEIKELVSKKIAGQGSQVDIGGALAEILNGIIDIAAGGLQAVEITEEITSAEGVEISASRYAELRRAVLLKEGGHYYVLSTCTGLNANLQSSLPNTMNTVVFANYVVAEDDGTLSEGEFLILAITTDDKYRLYSMGV